MVTKYRLKIDTPWASKDAVFFKNNSGYWEREIEGSVSYYLPKDPSGYPHLFEPIEEKSEVERVAEWFSERKNRWVDDEAWFFRLAVKLLSTGLNVDKLEGVG